ncbi:MAG: exopolysaccharide biosynthesis polyprenyl glycosylphosphotransferase, partial [Bryobacteraceae bacterium]
MGCAVPRRQEWEVRQDAWFAEVACQVLEMEEAPDGRCAHLGFAEPEAIGYAVEKFGIEILAVNSKFVSPELSVLLTELRFRGLRVYSLPDFCMQLSEELPLAILSDEWLSFSGGFDVLQSRLLRRVKRLSDLFLAAGFLLAAAPLMILTALAIRLDSPGPALFSQTRVGWKGRPYRLLKFRSMRRNAERNGAQWAQVDDPRVTRVGKWIRRLRIDELPQLFNVMAGQMSFVGPRPERPEFVERLEREIPFYQLRHCLAPGITGWAQVKYPYGASVEDARRKLQYDLYYIRNASPIIDFRILLRTVRTVLYLQGSR